jgi:hypothetical protein
MKELRLLPAVLEDAAQAAQWYDERRSSPQPMVFVSVVSGQWASFSAFSFLLSAFEFALSAFQISVLSR